MEQRKHSKEIAERLASKDCIMVVRCRPCSLGHGCSLAESSLRWLTWLMTSVSYASQLSAYSTLKKLSCAARMGYQHMDKTKSTQTWWRGRRFDPQLCVRWQRQRTMEWFRRRHGHVWNFRTFELYIAPHTSR